MMAESFAHFSCASFNISLQQIPTIAALASLPSHSPHLNPPSTSSPPPPPLPPSPRSKSLTILVPPPSSPPHSRSTTLPAPSPPSSPPPLLPPSPLTHPSQLRLFHPHHYFGRTIDLLTAPLYTEHHPRPYHLATLRAARRLGLRCVRCGVDPRVWDGVLGMASLTPPVRGVVGGEGEGGGGGGDAGWEGEGGGEKGLGGHGVRQGA